MTVCLVCGGPQSTWRLTLFEARFSSLTRARDMCAGAFSETAAGCCAELITTLIEINRRK